MRWQRVIVPSVLGSLLLVATTSVEATDGHFLHGVGAINSAMGGAGVAAPSSVLGTFYLNPAGSLGFDGTRIEFGFEMFKPERTLSSNMGPFGSGETTSKSDFVPIPAMGFSHKITEDVAFGVGLLGVGGFGVDYPSSSVNPILAPQPFGYGQVYSNYQLMKITPALAWAPPDNLWLGISANLDWAALAVNPAPFAPPAMDPGADGVFGTPDDRAFFSNATSSDGAFGIGFQAGALYRINNIISVGASFQSEQYFQDFEFNTTFANPNLGNFGQPHTITFGLDIPMVVSGGVALQPLPTVLLAGDFRYIFYENTDGFALPDGQVFNEDGSVAGFGWNNIYSIHGGVEWEAVEQLALRAGYNFSQNPIPHETAAINISAPAVVQHHLTLGAGVKLSRRMEISAAYYHAFEGSCHGEALTPGGPMPGTEVKSVMSENSFLVQFSFATRSF